jgi:hypothetical protein
MKVYRQGDVLFIADDFNIADVKGDKKHSHAIYPQMRMDDDRYLVSVAKSKTIRRGEHGGQHAIDPALDSDDFELYNTDSPMLKFVRVKKDTDIVHREHKTLRILAGKYVVRIQREGNEQQMRNVLD